MTLQRRVTSSALPWFITSRVAAVERAGLSEIEQACLALEIEGMPCPMNVDGEQWIRDNFAYICARYKERFPPKPVVEKKPKLSKAKRKAKRALDRQIARADKPKVAVKKVGGVDVKTDAFLSTYEWRKTRMLALKKYGPRCQCCGATPATGAVMNVDHIKPRKLFPELALEVSNLQILCHDCNHGKGNWDTTDWRNNS
jgi:5-methylcytosine-specific restriction endonuclease McrA